MRCSTRLQAFHATQRFRPFGFRRWYPWRAIVAGHVIFAAGCNSLGPEQLDPIVGNEPRQFSLLDDPEIHHHPNPDSLVLITSLRVADSTAHAEWLGTQLRIQSDAGLDTFVTVTPFACLEPQSGTLPFPFNFRWLSCNRIGVELSEPSPSRIKSLEEHTTGQVAETYPFLAQPGVLLVIEVPIGLEATSEAVRRAQGLPFVRSAYSISLDPECVRSDVVPPPPCPPWSFVLRVAYTFDSPSPQQQGPVLVVPVGPGGWIRATYEDLNGTTHPTQYMLP